MAPLCTAGDFLLCRNAITSLGMLQPGFYFPLQIMAHSGLRAGALLFFSYFFLPHPLSEDPFLASFTNWCFTFQSKMGEFLLTWGSARGKPQQRVPSPHAQCPSQPWWIPGARDTELPCTLAQCCRSAHHLHQTSSSTLLKYDKGFQGSSTSPLTALPMWRTVTASMARL